MVTFGIENRGNLEWEDEECRKESNIDARSLYSRPAR